jgi:Transmembrane protein 43
VKDTLVAVGLGLLLVVGSIAGLFWNEGRSIQTTRSLAEGGAMVIEADPARIEPGNDGKLVHVTGELKTTAPLKDPDFLVEAQAARLLRKVEMYQWKEESRSETRKTAGGGEERVTTYSYRRTWAENRIDSNRFHNRFGSASPRIGDQRTTFSLAPNGSASFIARQEGRDLTEYQTRAGDKLLLAAIGDVTATAMFKQAEDENRLVTWIIRLIGVVAMAFGWYLTLQWIGVVGDIVPFLGGLLQAGAGIVAALVTAVLAPLVIALAWMWYRPMVSLAVLAGGAAVAYGLRRIAKRRAAARPAAADAPTMSQATPAAPA